MTFRIRDITNLSLDQMEETFEFRVFTQFSYLIFDEAVKNGLKRSTHLSPTGKYYEQDAINAKMKRYHDTFLPQLGFQNSVTIFESWLFDVLRHLLSDKNRLNKKRRIEVSEIVTHNSLDELFKSIIESELNEIKYKKPSDWFFYLNNLVNITAPSKDQIDAISEIKASRDIIVHNEGIANEIYISKAGSLSRAKSGDRLAFDHVYAFESWKILNTVIKDVGQQISKKIEK